MQAADAYNNIIRAHYAHACVERKKIGAKKITPISAFYLPFYRVYAIIGKYENM